MKPDLREFEPYLAPTPIIDSDHETIVDFARSIVGRSVDPVDQAVRLFLAVRDGILYDPYSPFHLPEHYRASQVLKRGRAYCVPKASLLCALGRACRIPSRLGFDTVRNHLATRQLIEFIGSNLFVYHGFVEFHLQDKWVKATPAFNKELCQRHGVPPLEFDGCRDALFQAYNLQKQKFMEYLEYCGTYSDVPVSKIVSAWEEAYGKARVDQWIKRVEAHGSIRSSDFAREDVVKG